MDPLPFSNGENAKVAARYTVLKGEKKGGLKEKRKKRERRMKKRVKNTKGRRKATHRRRRKNGRSSERRSEARKRKWRRDDAGRLVAPFFLTPPPYACPSFLCPSFLLSLSLLPRRRLQNQRLKSRRESKRNYCGSLFHLRSICRFEQTHVNAVAVSQWVNLFAEGSTWEEIVRERLLPYG